MLELPKGSAPALAYAASILFLAHFAAATLFHSAVLAAAIHLLFVPALALLVMRVDAPSWARGGGFGWAGLGLLADILVLGSAATGGSTADPALLSALALVPGAAWIYGASMADEGAGHALGAAAAAGLVFSALLAIASRLILVASFDLGTIVQQLALVGAIVWFAVLAKDLSAGKRHVGGPVKVYA